MQVNEASFANGILGQTLATGSVSSASLRFISCMRNSVHLPLFLAAVIVTEEEMRLIRTVNQLLPDQHGLTKYKFLVFN